MGRKWTRVIWLALLLLISYGGIIYYALIHPPLEISDATYGEGKGIPGRVVSTGFDLINHGLFPIRLEEVKVEDFEGVKILQINAVVSKSGENVGSAFPGYPEEEGFEAEDVPGATLPVVWGRRRSESTGLPYRYGIMITYQELRPKVSYAKEISINYRYLGWPMILNRRFE